MGKKDKKRLRSQKAVVYSRAVKDVLSVEEKTTEETVEHTCSGGGCESATCTCKESNEFVFEKNGSGILSDSDGMLVSLDESLLAGMELEAKVQTSHGVLGINLIAPYRQQEGIEQRVSQAREQYLLGVVCAGRDRDKCQQAEKLSRILDLVLSDIRAHKALEALRRGAVVDSLSQLGGILYGGDTSVLHLLSDERFHELVVFGMEYAPHVWKKLEECIGTEAGDNSVIDMVFTSVQPEQNLSLTVTNAVSGLVQEQIENISCSVREQLQKFEEHSQENFNSLKQEQVNATVQVEDFKTIMNGINDLLIQMRAIIEAQQTVRRPVVAFAQTLEQKAEVRKSSLLIDNPANLVSPSAQYGQTPSSSVVRRDPVSQEKPVPSEKEQLVEPASEEQTLFDLTDSGNDEEEMVDLDNVPDLMEEENEFEPTSFPDEDEAATFAKSMDEMGHKDEPVVPPLTLPSSPRKVVVPTEDFVRPQAQPSQAYSQKDAFAAALGDDEESAI